MKRSIFRIDEDPPGRRVTVHDDGSIELTLASFFSSALVEKRPGPIFISQLRVLCDLFSTDARLAHLGMNFSVHDLWFGNMTTWLIRFCDRGPGLMMRIDCFGMKQAEIYLEAPIDVEEIVNAILAFDTVEEHARQTNMLIRKHNHFGMNTSGSRNWYNVLDAVSRTHICRFRGDLEKTIVIMEFTGELSTFETPEEALKKIVSIRESLNLD